MKRTRYILLAVGIVVFPLALLVVGQFSADASYQLGDHVLAECDGFFVKGRVHKIFQTGYQLEFAKETKPILCTPYLWRSEFLTAYSPADELNVDEMELHVGDPVQVSLGSRSPAAEIVARIRDISSNGLVALDLVEAVESEAIYFRKQIGTNYLPVSDHEFSILE